MQFYPFSYSSLSLSLSLSPLPLRHNVLKFLRSVHFSWGNRPRVASILNYRYHQKTTIKLDDTGLGEKKTENHRLCPLWPPVHSWSFSLRLRATLTGVINKWHYQEIDVRTWATVRKEIILGWLSFWTSDENCVWTIYTLMSLV
jgi:hypothetical protein